MQGTRSRIMGSGGGASRLAGALAGAALAAALVVASPAAAQRYDPFPGSEDNRCLNLDDPAPEALYGPTDIGATAGNGRLSVAVNPQGTLSVFRWPSMSYWEQLRYFTTSRDKPRLGTAPNEGAFSGLALELRGGERRTVWLRDLPHTQRYSSEDSDAIATSYRSRRLGIAVEVLDVVPRRGDVLLRRHELRTLPGSPVRGARLIAFANLNPTASKAPLLPVEDWCDEVDGTDVAAYDPAADAIVYSISERDQSAGEQRSVAVAIGAGRRSDGHQVGGDTYTGHPSAGGVPQSAYDDAADGELSGNGAAGPAELDAALSVPTGGRPVTLVLAAGEDPAAATALLERYRRSDPLDEARAKRRSYLRWLADAPLPRGAPDEVRRLARRALVSLRQAIDTRAGSAGDRVAIAASLSTQSPYFLDWIRDGAFFNEALDVIGHPGLVERHNLFYVETQKTVDGGDPPGTPSSHCAQPTPAGNWFMTNYADGGDAGLLPWEIDEAAFGLWTLWRHHEHLSALGASGGRARAAAYLDAVYPAIRNTAEFLVAFRDPSSGLPPGTACEDDNFPPPGRATMHSAGPVLLAMRSAEAAAERVGDAAGVESYRARRLELERAIDEGYREPGGAWTADFGVGGWALWPVKVRPYADPRSRAQAELAWEGVRPSFEAPDGPRTRGQYEAKALHGLAHYHRAVDPDGMGRVKRGLRWIAGVQAGYQRTGILGEIWYARDGEVRSVLSQPHVWEQVLFYLAAIEAYGRAPYRPGETR